MFTQHWVLVAHILIWSIWSILDYIRSPYSYYSHEYSCSKFIECDGRDFPAKISIIFSIDIYFCIFLYILFVNSFESKYSYVISITLYLKCRLFLFSVKYEKEVDLYIMPPNFSWHSNDDSSFFTLPKLLVVYQPASLFNLAKLEWKC